MNKKTALLGLKGPLLEPGPIEPQITQKLVLRGEVDARAWRIRGGARRLGESALV